MNRRIPYSTAFYFGVRYIELRGVGSIESFMFITKKIKGRIVRYKQCSMVYSYNLYECSDYYGDEECIYDYVNPECGYSRLEHYFPKNYDEYYKLTGVEVAYYIRNKKRIGLSYNRLTRTATVIEDV